MIIALALLIFQYHAGVTTNLFVIIPASNPLGILIVPSALEFLLHIINGFVTLTIAMLFLVHAIRLRHRGLFYASLLGLAFVGVAIIAGFIFFLAGQDNTYSITMGMSFISVFTIFFVELYILGRIEKTGTEKTTVIGNSPETAE